MLGPCQLPGAMPIVSGAPPLEQSCRAETGLAPRMHLAGCIPAESSVWARHFETAVTQKAAPTKFLYMQDLNNSSHL